MTPPLARRNVFVFGSEALPLTSAAPSSAAATLLRRASGFVRGVITANPFMRAKPATTRIALDAALRRRPEGVEGEAIMVMVAEGGARCRAIFPRATVESARPIRPRRLALDALPLEMKKRPIRGT